MAISHLFGTLAGRSVRPAARGLLLALAATGATAASAQVTGVVTTSHVSAQLTPAPGGTGLFDFDGTQIHGSLGSNALGAGATFASTARVDPDGIDFQNGNAGGGQFAFMSSRTAIDISFTNDSGHAVLPSLHSTILPSGLGLFIDHPCLNDVATCAPGHVLSGLQDLKNFLPGTGPGPSDEIAGASFSFTILSGSKVVYSLSGSVMLVYDAVSHGDVLVTDLDAASAALSGFRLTSLPGDTTAFGVAWDATDIDVAFPPDTLLQPGEAATLTYQSTVESFSRSSCAQANAPACVIAYSSFGDPVGRGGGIHPTSALMAEADAPAGFDFATYQFQHPVFHDGVVSFAAAAVAEPATWAMLIAGFGLVGAALRRRPIHAPLRT